MEEPSRRDPTSDDLQTSIAEAGSKSDSSGRQEGDAVSSRTVVDGTTKRKRHSLFRKPKKLLGNAGRRFSQPNMKSSLRQFLDDQKSQRDALDSQCQDPETQSGALNKEKEKMYSYEAQIETLQQEKGKLKDRLEASGSISSELSELVDTHAMEMQKTINLCKKQMDTIDTLRKSRQSLKAENDQIKKQVASLKRDRKSLRTRVKEVEPKAGDEGHEVKSTPSESPPPLLEKASMELLVELLEQDEAINVLKLSPALSLEGDRSKELSEVKYQLDGRQKENKMLEEALWSAEQDKFKLQSLLEEQTKLTEEGVAAKMLVEDEFDLWQLRQSYSETALRQELEEQRALVQKLNSELDVQSSNAQYFESMCKQQCSLIATLQTQNDALTDQFMVQEEAAASEVSNRKLSSKAENDGELRQKLQAAESEIERLKVAGEEYTSRLQNCKTSLEFRNADLERLAGANENLVDELKTLQEETRRMRQLNRRMSSTITMQEDTIECLKLEQESLGRDKDVLVKQLDAAKQSASLLELLKGPKESSTRYNELDRRCESQGIAIDSLRQSNCAMSKELQMTKDSMESCRKLLNEKELVIQDQSRTVRELEGSLELQVTESEYLRRQMGFLSKELEGERSKLAMAEDSLAAMEKLIGENSIRIGSIESSLEDNRVELHLSREVVEAQKLQLAQNEEKLRVQCIRIDSFEDSKREQELRCEDNDANVESMKGKLERMKQELSVSRSTCSVLQDQVTATLDAKEEEVSEKIASLKEENAVLSETLKEAENKASEARLSLTKQEARRAGHAVAIRALQKENERLLKHYLEGKLVTSALEQSLSKLMSEQAEDIALRATFESRIRSLNEDLRGAHMALSPRRQSLTEKREMKEAVAIATLKRHNTKLSDELREAQLSISSLQKSLAEQKAQHEKEAVNVEYHVTKLATLMEREVIADSKILQLRENVKAQEADIEMYVVRAQQLKEQVHAMKNERDNLLALAELHAASAFVTRVAIPVHQQEPNEGESTEEVVASYKDVAAPLTKVGCSVVEFKASFDDTSSCGDFADDSDSCEEYFDDSDSEESDGALEADAQLPVIAGSRSLATGTLILMDRSRSDPDEHCQASYQCPTSSPAKDVAETNQQRPTVLNIMDVTSLDADIFDLSKSGTITKIEDLPPLTSASLVMGSNDSGDEDEEMHVSPCTDISPEVEFDIPFVR